jgi:hypothetical protein
MPNNGKYPYKQFIIDPPHRALSLLLADFITSQPGISLCN